MKLYVAVTDNQWFRFLRSRPELDEVNFWQPGGGQAFRALPPGEPLLFKLHSPENFVVGGGFFETSSRLPCSLAWEVFGEKNGVPSFEQMRARIEKYRRTPPAPHEDYEIGCRVLRAPYFFHDNSWIPIPTSFSLSIQKGKTYSAEMGEGQALWEEVKLRLDGTRSPSVLADTPMYGTPALVRPRLGQGGFRVVITDTYERRCAVTHEKALPALEAAHIQSVSQGGQHRVDNGLLLRADVHRLFDRGYVTVTPDHRFLVSRKLKEDFANGEPYYPLAGQTIWLPKRIDARPHLEFLEWHTDTVFKG
jgi:putative restriction endonuclease